MLLMAAAMVESSFRLMPATTNNCDDYSMHFIPHLCVSCLKDVDFVPVVQGDTLRCTISGTLNELDETRNEYQYVGFYLTFQSRDGSRKHDTKVGLEHRASGSNFSEAFSFHIADAGYWDIIIEKVEFIFSESDRPDDDVNKSVLGIYIPTEDEADVRLLSRNVLLLTVVLLVFAIPTTGVAVVKLIDWGLKEDSE